LSCARFSEEVKACIKIEEGKRRDWPPFTPTKLKTEEERAVGAPVDAPKEGLEGDARPPPRPEGRRVPEPRGRGDLRESGADEV
jgi:hypothetical protein